MVFIGKVRKCMRRDADLYAIHHYVWIILGALSTKWIQIQDTFYYSTSVFSWILTTIWISNTHSQCAYSLDYYAWDTKLWWTGEKRCVFMNHHIWGDTYDGSIIGGAIMKITQYFELDAPTSVGSFQSVIRMLEEKWVMPHLTAVCWWTMLDKEMDYL